MKLGKAPFQPDARDAKFAFAKYLTATLPQRPASFGHERGFQWGMLGNDRYGDCVFAGGAHEQMLFAREGNKSVAFTSDAVLHDYGAVTGFDPVTGAGDNGTNVRDAMKYRQRTGLLATNGRHKISAYLSIDPKNVGHILTAAYLFGACGIGIEFPSSAMDQFNAGKPWSVVKGSPIEGGHYIPVVGRRGGYIEVVTWGKTQRVTAAFLKSYCDEAWCVVSPEILTNGKTPEGFDLAQLRADLAAL